MKKRLIYSLFSAAFMFLVLVQLSAESGTFYELELHKAVKPVERSRTINRPNLLPGSQIARGEEFTAWLAYPTKRYRHGILGDDIEASSIIVETKNRKLLKFDLPESRVFEDLMLRLADLDGDGKDEILVVESDVSIGASLSIFSIRNEKLERITATPFLGRPNRWLNPLGFGDFNGDGNPDIALVATPHIGGILRLYRFENDRLTLFSEYRGVSTHSIGSTELGLGSVVPMEPRDMVLLPDQSHKAMLLLEFAHNELKEIARIELPAAMESSLTPIADDRWRLRLADGGYYEIKLLSDD